MTARQGIAELKVHRKIEFLGSPKTSVIDKNKQDITVQYKNDYCPRNDRPT